MISVTSGWLSLPLFFSPSPATLKDHHFSQGGPWTLHRSPPRSWPSPRPASWEIAVGGVPTALFCWEEGLRLAPRGGMARGQDEKALWLLQNTGASEGDP